MIMIIELLFLQISQQLSVLGFEKRVPIPSSVNAFTAIAMINLGPHAKVDWRPV